MITGEGVPLAHVVIWECYVSTFSQTGPTIVGALTASACTLACWSILQGALLFWCSSANFWSNAFLFFDSDCSFFSYAVLILGGDGDNALLILFFDSNAVS